MILKLVVNVPLSLLFSLTKRSVSKAWSQILSKIRDAWSSRTGKRPFLSYHNNVSTVQKIRITAGSDLRKFILKYWFPCACRFQLQESGFGSEILCGTRIWRSKKRFGHSGYKNYQKLPQIIYFSGSRTEKIDKGRILGGLKGIWMAFVGNPPLVRIRWKT